MCVFLSLAVARFGRSVIESLIKLGGKPAERFLAGEVELSFRRLLYASHAEARRIFLFCSGFEATEVFT